MTTSYIAPGARRAHAADWRSWEPAQARDDPGTVHRPDGDAPQFSAAIPGGTTTTEVLSIGGSRTGSIDFVGDGDAYRVSLVAGQSYLFTMSGAGGTPLSDTYLVLTDSTGRYLAIDDDAGPGASSLLRYTATSSGVYFLTARGYEAQGVSNTGGYVVSAAVGPPQNPLDTIDLGTTVGQLNIGVYFAGPGELNGFGDRAVQEWSPEEIAAAFNAFNTFSAVTNLVFTQVASAAAARFVMTLADLPTGTLGYFGTVDGVGYGAFDPFAQSWTAAGLTAGGTGFITLIHEIGHGLGLAHPHDNGGTSEIMEGVVSDFRSYGTYGLNQGVFTMMSYNDGYPALGSPAGAESTPMPLDIALLQEKYGANPGSNAGPTTYVLPLSGTDPGVSWVAIWDTSGVDEIVSNSTRDAIIDLRPATLMNEVGGGGYASYNLNVRAGFVIAAGVVIENASGGAGSDTITGNSAANVLRGNDGDDTLAGGYGDTLDGGNGVDLAVVTLSERTGTITFTVGDPAVRENGMDVVATTNTERISIVGGSAADTLVGGALADVLDGGAGVDSLTGGLGNDGYGIDSTADAIHELAGQGDDAVFTTLNLFFLGITAGSANVENLVYTGSSDFTGVATDAGPASLTGGPGNDTLIGSKAGGTLTGGAGDDVLWYYGETTLWGGAGFDYAIQLDQGQGTVSLLGIEAFVGGAGDNNVFVNLLFETGPVVIYGGGGDDHLSTGEHGGVVFGQDGDDFLNAFSFNNTLIGNAGVDTFAGGSGNDVFYIDAADGQRFDGHQGIDYAIVEAGGGAVNVDLATRNIEVFIGNTGNDVINASGVDYAMGLYGGSGNDMIVGAQASSQLFGMDGDDILNAGAINDVVLGGDGADQVFGNAGDDLLIGEAGDDLIVGGAGADTLYGDVNGVGSDTFRFAAGDVQAGVRDQIVDFGDVAGNQDVIQFSGVAQNQVTVANDGAGNVLLTVAASGGVYSILVIGMTAAALQDDLVFGP